MDTLLAITRAEALDRELEAFFSEARRELANQMRSHSFTWRIAFMGGRCTDVLIKSENTQESYQSLTEIPLPERTLRRRLERLAEGLQEFLGELSENCDREEEKAHGILCSFEGVDGRLQEVLLEVFCRESFASDVIKLRLEVARTACLRDAVAIPLHRTWYNAIAPLDDKFYSAKGWTEKNPDEPWPWLLRHILVGMRGTRDEHDGAEVLRGLAALTFKAAAQSRSFDAVTERAIHQAIGELALFHDTRELALDGARERQYWENPPPRIAHAVTWKIVAALMKRHATRKLAVFELHPGGGMGDTLSLRDMGQGGVFGEELNDFRAYRRLGRGVARGEPDPLGEGGYYVRRALFGRDFETLIDDICGRCRLSPGEVPEDLDRHPKLLGYKVMAELIALRHDSRLELEWRSAICDTSGYPGTSVRPAFDPDQGGFKTILKTLPPVTEGVINPLYGVWMLVRRGVGAIRREDVLLVVQPETATAWGRSKGKKPKAIDLPAVMATEGAMWKLVNTLWSKRMG